MKWTSNCQHMMPTSGTIPRRIQGSTKKTAQNISISTAETLLLNNHPIRQPITIQSTSGSHKLHKLGKEKLQSYSYMKPTNMNSSLRPKYTNKNMVFCCCQTCCFCCCFWKNSPFVCKKLGPTHLLNRVLPRIYKCHGGIHQFSMYHNHVHVFFSKEGQRIIIKPEIRICLS